MILAPKIRAGRDFDRLVHESEPVKALQASVDHLLAAGFRCALAGLVDELGELLEQHTPGFDRNLIQHLPHIAAHLAAVGGAQDPPDELTVRGMSGIATELHEGRFAVVLTRHTDVPPDDWPEAETARRSAVLAVARVGMIDQAQRRSDEISRLQATAKGVAALVDLDEVLSRIVTDAVGLIGGRSGEMLLLDERAQKLRMVAVSNLPDELLGFEIEFGEGLASQAIIAEKPLYVADYGVYEHRIDRLMDRFRWGAMACSPLIVHGTPLGALNVHFARAKRGFRTTNLELLAAFADHAAIAIDHARRYENEVRLAAELATANEELSRSLKLQMRLTEQVVLDRGLKGIAEELARLLEHPVAVQDHLWRVVAGASPDGTDKWATLVVQRPAGERNGRAGRESGSRSLVHSAPPQGGATGRFVLPVLLHRETVGYLVLPGERQLAPLDRALAEIAVGGVALEFAKLRATAEVEDRLRGEAVLDLITGSFSSAESIAERCARLGYDLSDSRHMMVLRIEPVDMEMSVGAQERSDIRRRALELLRDEVSRRAPGSMLVSHGESVVVLAAVSVDDGLSAMKLAGNLRQVVSKLPRSVVSVAIGDVCSEPAAYPTAFRLARETLELMARLGRRGMVVSAAELGAYRLILKSTSREELEQLARRTLGPLIDHDARHGSNLVATVRAYLEEGQVQRRAADRLVVHVNTVVYRLRRVEELLKVDLANPSQVFDIMFALRVLDALGEG